jgi:opacity protein-like surface antigen
MAKRVFISLVLAAFAAGSLAALPDFSLSAGGGGYIGGDFGGGVKISDSNFEVKMPYFGGGGYIFLDAAYAELSFGIFGGGGKIKNEFGGRSSEEKYNLTNLNLGLLGKYPFAVGEKMSVFPLLGVDYQITTAAKVGGEKMDDPKDLSALWFKFGGGLDYEITSNIFVRVEGLYGFRIPNKMEKDLKNSFNTPRVDVQTRLGHGLTVKLAAGYKF